MISYVSVAIIAGLDEVGRGCLAGPVVAAACIFDKKLFRGKKIPRIADSKQMTEAEREEAYEFLIAHVSYGVGMADASIVDAIGNKPTGHDFGNKHAYQAVRWKPPSTGMILPVM